MANSRQSRQSQPRRCSAYFTWIAPATVFATFKPHQVFSSFFGGSFRFAGALVQFQPTHQIISVSDHYGHSSSKLGGKKANVRLKQKDQRKG